jgi:N-acetylmuramoyl-L-alanine amidase
MVAAPQRASSLRTWTALAALGLASLACVAPQPGPVSSVTEPGPRVAAYGPNASLQGPAGIRTGTEIVIAGKRVDIGAPVVLWMDEGGYNAYSTTPRFADEGELGLRYTPGRLANANQVSGQVAARLERGQSSVQELGEAIDQFVIHYDVCGTSRVCFKVLHDRRMLSVHFMLDLDGTLYQTLDLKDKAWHAAKANGRSVGVEIAQIGAYPLAKADAADSPLAEWYEDLPGGTTKITLPARYEGGHFRRTDPVLATATGGRKQGRVQGEQLYQYDFTAAQYETLAHLAAALNKELPQIELEIPRAPGGEVLPKALSEDEWADFQGLLGHYHVTTRKTDPGPAFDWDGVLLRARELRAALGE